MANNKDLQEISYEGRGQILKFIFFNFFFYPVLKQGSTNLFVFPYKYI